MAHGVRVSLFPKGQIAEALYLYRYENEELGLFVRCLKPGMNVLDIGANIGIYSLVADKLVGGTGRVWAFEPSTEAYNMLLANLSLNKVASVVAEKIALSDTVGSTAILKRDPGYKDGERYLSMRKEAAPRENTASGDSGDSETVEVTTLDGYMHAGGDRWPRIDFIKMDVEGLEYSVLRGAKTVLAKNDGIVLFFECTRQGCALAGHTIEDVFEFVRKLGFDLYGWCPKRKTWDDSEEYLKTVGNIWACRKKGSLP